MEKSTAKNRGRESIALNKTTSRRDNGQPLNVPISAQQIIFAIKKMKRKERLAFLEDLLAATSPKYLDSIRETREDYRRGVVLTHDEVFAKEIHRF